MIARNFSSMALIFGAIFVPALSGAASIKEEKLTITQNKTKFVSPIYYDSSIKEKRGAVLIAPEWWGITDLEKKTAKALAEKGYTALVIDLYGDGKSTMEPLIAKQFMDEAQSNIENYNDRFMKVLSELKKHPSVDDKRVVLMGYGLGGGLAIEMARLGADVLGVIDYFGALNPIDAKPVKSIGPEILLFVGDDDSYVPPSQVKRFRNEMKKIKAKVTIEVYPKVFHGFTREGIDAIAKKNDLSFKYDAAATKDSWEKTLKFLDRKFFVHKI